MAKDRLPPAELEALKARLMTPKINVDQVSKDTGIPRATLYRWRAEAILERQKSQVAGPVVAPVAVVRPVVEPLVVAPAEPVNPTALTPVEKLQADRIRKLESELAKKNELIARLTAVLAANGLLGGK